MGNFFQNIRNMIQSDSENEESVMSQSQSKDYMDSADLIRIKNQKGLGSPSKFKELSLVDD